MKHICKRDLLRNPYKHIGNEPLIATLRGNPDLFVGKIDTVDNLSNTVNSLSAFQSSLSTANTVKQPIIGQGGSIHYEKHSPK